MAAVAVGDGGDAGGVTWMVVESKRLLLIDDTKLSIRICQHPF